MRFASALAGMCWLPMLPKRGRSYKRELAFGQVLDSGIAPNMFDWTPPILITA